MPEVLTGLAVMVMTQQYLAGELSLLLAQLRTVAANESSRQQVAGLRREAETMPPQALASVAVRSVELAEAMCWNSIARGDAAAFSGQSEACAALYESACAPGCSAKPCR